jgi:membrane protein implicated in regulation of membrane protease activity
MGYAYLFALIVGLGILTVQVLLGSKDGDAGKDVDGIKDVDGAKEIETGKDLVHAGAEGGGLTGADLLAMFASVRFWVFGMLAFGLSGSLLTYLSDVPAFLTAIVASGLGVGSGLGASVSWRLLNRGSGRLTEDKRAAVGRLARVLVPVSEGGVGKVRIELSGQTVDLMARTTGGGLERGDQVLIEDIDGEIAQVSRAPDEVRD